MGANPLLGETCKERLENWKFDSALRDMDEGPFQPTSNEAGTIRALSATFGNSGWFNGSLGDVVRAAVQRLLDGYPDEDEDL